MRLQFARIAFLIFVSCVAGYASTSPMEASTQAVVVLANGWNDRHATLQRFGRLNGEWKSMGAPVPCVMGHNGLAWGRGVMPTLESSKTWPRKREGDGRSPAGIFRISGVFGFATPKQAASLVHMPYIQLTEPMECVDDARSSHYNQVVDAKKVTRDWSSAERMRKIAAYQWGAFVDHNTDVPMAGAGSCIFLHIWGGPDGGTAGCTALDKEALLRVLGWLRPEARPLLIQMPRDVYGSLREQWALP